MNAIIQWIKKNASNPFFVTAWTLFAGALGKELVTTLETGKIDLTLKSFESMAAAAVSTTVIALIHLYIIPQNPTVQATIPPSKTVVDVPAQLEPIDPKAVPANPQK